MPNILAKYLKNGVITTGADNVQLDTPTFEIIAVNIDTVEQMLVVEVMHYVNQGAVVQQHHRTFNVSFASLPLNVRQTGKAFLDAIEAQLLLLPQYQGSVLAP
jgi:hypothetical protein